MDPVQTEQVDVRYSSKKLHQSQHSRDEPMHSSIRWLDKLMKKQNTVTASLNNMQQNSDIILPKKHLSWSQMVCWETNKDRYRREYFENGKKLDTKYLRFGKGIAQMIEELQELCINLHRDIAVDELIKTHDLDDNARSVLMTLDIDGTSEYKISMLLRGVPILSYIDLYKPDQLTFREFKTGLNPWSMVKVQKHGQLVFYATMLRALTGKMPPFCDLDWLPTRENVVDEEAGFWEKIDSNKKLTLTGHIHSYRRYFDIREIEKMEERILKAATEISDAYKAYIQEI